MLKFETGTSRTHFKPVWKNVKLPNVRHVPFAPLTFHVWKTVSILLLPWVEGFSSTAMIPSQNVELCNKNVCLAHSEKIEELHKLYLKVSRSTCTMRMLHTDVRWTMSTHLLCKTSVCHSDWCVKHYCWHSFAYIGEYYVWVKQTDPNGGVFIFVLIVCLNPSGLYFKPIP